MAAFCRSFYFFYFFLFFFLVFLVSLCAAELKIDIDGKSFMVNTVDFFGSHYKAYNLSEMYVIVAENNPKARGDCALRVRAYKEALGQQVMIVLPWTEAIVAHCETYSQAVESIQKIKGIDQVTLQAFVIGFPRKTNSFNGGPFFDPYASPSRAISDAVPSIITVVAESQGFKRMFWRLRKKINIQASLSQDRGQWNAAFQSTAYQVFTWTFVSIVCCFLNFIQILTVHSTRL